LRDTPGYPLRDTRLGIEAITPEAA
jgi:hypothetical protein